MKFKHMLSRKSFRASISARVFKDGSWRNLGVIAHPEERNPILHAFKKLVGYHFATVLTSVGEAWIVDKLDETLQTVANYIGWGTGAGTSAKGDTTLFTEAAETRVEGTPSQPAADKLRYVGTITSLSGQTITNAGNFTAITSGTLVVHGDFTGVALLTNDKIEFTIDRCRFMSVS